MLMSGCGGDDTRLLRAGPTNRQRAQWWWERGNEGSDVDDLA